MLMGVPAGNPLRFTTNVAVAEVTFPDESCTAFSVMVAVPPPADSAPVIGGTSSDGRSAAVNVCVPFQEGALGESLFVHADTAARDTTNANVVTYFICQLLSSNPIVKRICD